MRETGGPHCGCGARPRCTRGAARSCSGGGPPPHRLCRASPDCGPSSPASSPPRSPKAPSMCSVRPPARRTAGAARADRRGTSARRHRRPPRTSGPTRWAQCAADRASPLHSTRRARLWELRTRGFGGSAPNSGSSVRESLGYYEGSERVSAGPM